MNPTQRCTFSCVRSLALLAVASRPDPPPARPLGDYIPSCGLVPILEVGHDRAKSRRARDIQPSSAAGIGPGLAPSDGHRSQAIHHRQIGFGPRLAAPRRAPLDLQEIHRAKRMTERRAVTRTTIN